ncbi:hypothetical protein I551_8080 [Mycobacterium ulcerans str. Harvey]|uniref:Uncharacterized protein n=1 Tax=Mycobacterium ulcerans str. Harvey TaxID=1299332 RepID=A0ABN0QLU5_MYCUL|nr:hypothetical protein I551_8080 [Mycobacterium ulcerans str. Harvey]
MGNDIPPSPPGEGAEITLHEVPVLSGLGLTMTGPGPADSVRSMTGPTKSAPRAT